MKNDLFDEPFMAQFYDLANQNRDDFRFCQQIAKGARSILDLGCGTGKLACILATNTNKKVTGVEPASAMIEVAQKRRGAERVRWVQADARTVRLNSKYDLILLTGHTFQVLLNDTDRRKVISTIAKHLSPNGQFIFDSRNPKIGVCEHHERKWYPDLEHPNHGTVHAWNESVYDPTSGILSYKNGYTIKDSGRSLSASAKISYITKEHLENLLEREGLEVEQWFGNWNGDPYQDHSREIIPFGRLRRPNVAL